MGVYDSVPSANVPATLRSSLRYGERQEERPESALADRALAQCSNANHFIGYIRIVSAQSTPAGSCELDERRKDHVVFGLLEGSA